MTVADDPLAQAQALLDDTLETLGNGSEDPALLLAARNAVVALGGLVRFAAPVATLVDAVERTLAAIRPLLARDPGDTLMYPLLESRADALAEVVRTYGDLDRLEPDQRQDWLEEAYVIFNARDAADAWLLGTAALLRRIAPGTERAHLERTRERGVAAIVAFDRALEPALRGLSPLRDDAKKAVLRARVDRGYVRRAHYWVAIIEA